MAADNKFLRQVPTGVWALGFVSLDQRSHLAHRAGPALCTGLPTA